MKAPQDENRKGKREREEKLRVLVLQYRKRRTEGLTLNIWTINLQFSSVSRTEPSQAVR